MDRLWSARGSAIERLRKAFHDLFGLDKSLLGSSASAVEARENSETLWKDYLGLLDAEGLNDLQHTLAQTPPILYENITTRDIGGLFLNKVLFEVESPHIPRFDLADIKPFQIARVVIYGPTYLSKSKTPKVRSNSAFSPKKLGTMVSVTPGLIAWCAIVVCLLKL